MLTPGTPRQEQNAHKSCDRRNLSKTSHSGSREGLLNNSVVSVRGGPVWCSLTATRTALPATPTVSVQTHGRPLRMEPCECGKICPVKHTTLFRLWAPLNVIRNRRLGNKIRTKYTGTLTTPVAGTRLLSAHSFSRLTEEPGYIFQNETTTASHRQKQAAGKWRQVAGRAALTAGAMSIHLPVAEQPHCVGTAKTSEIPQTTWDKTKKTQENQFQTRAAC